MKKTILAIASVLLLASASHAFDVKLIYSFPPGNSWTNDYDTSFTTNSSVTIGGTTTNTSSTVNTHHDVELHTLDTQMIGLEIGHYKNSNHEGFGFGWHIGAAYPVGEEFSDAGTIDLGIAPGYSITRNFAVKLEFGIGSKRGFELKDNKLSSVPLLYGLYGLSAEYVFVNHLVVGAEVKFREYVDSDSFGVAKATPGISVAYRF